MFLLHREKLEDLWFCPHCCEERSATKTTTICRYPDTLIVHLKRSALFCWHAKLFMVQIMTRYSLSMLFTLDEKMDLLKFTNE